MIALSALACRGSPPRPGPAEATAIAPLVDVVSVDTTGDPGAYTFAVGLRSDETGCDQYADWWEIVDADGALVHRRILAHSHPDEQPFVRSGGPVDVMADQPLWIRGHLHPTGYAGTVFTGTVAAGFAASDEPPPEADLADVPPQPDGCAF